MGGIVVSQRARSSSTTIIFADTKMKNEITRLNQN